MVSKSNRNIFFTLKFLFLLKGNDLRCPCLSGDSHFFHPGPSTSTMGFIDYTNKSIFYKLQVFLFDPYFPCHNRSKLMDLFGLAFPYPLSHLRSIYDTTVKDG